MQLTIYLHAEPAGGAAAARVVATVAARAEAGVVAKVVAKAEAGVAAKVEAGAAVGEGAAEKVLASGPAAIVSVRRAGKRFRTNRESRASNKNARLAAR